MAKNMTEADLVKLRKRWADEDAGLIPKKQLTPEEKFNQDMMNKANKRAYDAFTAEKLKKKKKPKLGY